MTNSIETEIFRSISNLQKQIADLKERTEKSLDSSSIVFQHVQKIEKKLLTLSITVKKAIQRITRVLNMLDKNIK